MTALGKYADIAYNYNVIMELMLCVQEEYRKGAVIRKLVIQRKQQQSQQSASF